MKLYPLITALCLFIGFVHAKPNFIVIFVDDLGYGDLGSYGSPTIKTPRLDKMADEGLRMTSFYVGSAVCSASRAALLTGRYPARNGTHGVYFPGHGGLNPEETTIAELLKAESYATACIGKWHLGEAAKYLPTNHGFDEYFGIPYSNDMYIGPDMKLAQDIVYREGWDEARTRGDMELVSELKDDFRAVHRSDRNLSDQVPLMENDEIVEYPADQTTLTKRYFERTMDFIERADGEPFFVFLTPAMPHIPLFADEPFLGKSERGIYGDTVEEIDWYVGELLDYLDAEGLSEDTLVLFTSDNGPWLGIRDAGGSAGPLKDGKFSNYEGGVRVPAIFRWPGVIPAGLNSSTVVSTLDLLPTFAELSGAEMPETTIDGLDVSGFLAEPETAVEREYFAYMISGRLNAIRQGHWKYIPGSAKPTWRQDDGDEPKLFHLGLDPYERDNRAEKEPEVMATMQALFAELDAEFSQYLDN